MNETLALLARRRSVRRFSSRPVSPEDRESILAAAMRAPTAGNMMLYSIIEVTDPDIKAVLAETCDHQPFIASAPMVLVFCADYRRWMRKFAACGCDGGRPRPLGEGDLLLACNDTLIAAQTAVVAAESLGIGSCYIGDILEQGETHAELLGLPPWVMPVAMAVFGYPEEGRKSPPLTSRFPREMIVFENRYHDLTPEELDRFAEKTNVAAFYRRKHGSDFSREMNRSAHWMLRRWMQGEEPEETP